MNDKSLDLRRFVEAQNPIFETVLLELRSGHKQSHWMWFIFPQLKSLGRSMTALHYGITSLSEAQAFLAHPILGVRLAACTKAVIESQAASLHALFGSPDDLKFKSSMTLFELASNQTETVFGAAIDKWCMGERDAATLSVLAADR